MGPTASGKTDLAIALAEQFPVGIISVDSAQIFRQLDIGSAKPDIATLAKYPHQLINIREPSEAYSVGEFIKDAKEEMVSITNAGKVPLLVGGTMLYFKKLLEGMAELHPADADIRKSILKRADDEGWPVLFDELRRHDPQTASKIHPNHSQRIQRALEVLYITGETLSDQQQYNFQSKKYRKIKNGEKLNGDFKRGFVSSGLWSISRHPNFACEQIIWVVFYMFSINASGDFFNWSIIGCLLLIILFYNSAQFSEEISKDKYPEYENYQKNVPMFFGKWNSNWKK